MRTQAKELTRQLCGDWHGIYGLVPDVGHSKNDRGLKVWDAPDGRVFVHSFHGIHWREVQDGLRQLGFDIGYAYSGLASEGNEVTLTRPTRDTNDEQRRVNHARFIHETSRLLSEDTPAAIYLRRRGIEPPYPDSLRFHGSAPVMEKGGRKYCPAMVSLIRNVKQSINCGVHLTYLNEDGTKAMDVRAVKKIRGCPAGGGLWPDKIGKELIIAEGIETALSAERILKRPAVAALNAGLMVKLEVPETVRTILVVADNDDVGKRKAMEAARRFLELGFSVETYKPVLGKDMNDMLMALRGAK